LTTIYWDVETYSPVDLRETGAFVYLEDKDTMPICAAWAAGEEGEAVPFVPREAALPFLGSRTGKRTTL